MPERLLPKASAVAHRVAAVVLEGANLFEFAVAAEVFGIERPEVGRDLYAFDLCAPTGRARLAGGAELTTPGDLETIAAADTVIVPHGGAHHEAPGELLDAMRAAHAAGARLVSFCSGAFTLAATGLLDGRRATTHWMLTEQFRRRFPRVTLDPDVLFVDEGDVLTSAGTAAGIDLALHLVRLDHGADVARGIARRMVVPPHRDGGQAQFVDPPHEPRVPADRMGGLLDWLRSDLRREVTVADMARRSTMSERTFVRRFKETTGTTPFRWVAGQRLQRAQQLLEVTDLDVDQVAAEAGFGTAANLRQHFRRELGTTPSAYRRSFGGAAVRRREAG
jgi:AraC family transcriptional regulator, transcriptional activator FtrA